MGITVSPRLDTRAYALEERLPAGCRVVEISDSGHLDAAHHPLKWGPFTEESVKAVQYTLLPAATNTGPIAFGGVVSFDGANRLVQGDDRVRRAPRLALSPQPSEKRLVLQLGDDPGGELILETSTDLLHWTPVMTVTNQAGALQMPVPVSSDAQRYYRVTPR